MILIIKDMPWYGFRGTYMNQVPEPENSVSQNLFAAKSQINGSRETIPLPHVTVRFEKEFYCWVSLFHPYKTILKLGIN